MIEILAWIYGIIAMFGFGLFIPHAINTPTKWPVLIMAFILMTVFWPIGLGIWLAGKN